MKRFTRYVIFTILGFALSSPAWAQQRDLEVTMDVVPANASAGAATSEIKLPLALPPTASSRARDASAFGLGTANSAREMQGDLGRDFGQGVSEAARARDHHTPNLPPQSKRP